MVWWLCLLGAQLNVLRGGWPISAKWAHGLVLGLILLGISLSDSSVITWWQAVLAGIGMWGGAQIGGWGEYVENILHRRFTPRSEVKWIDTIADRVGKTPTLRGLIALTLRGGQWGALPSIALVSFWPLLAGLLMGCIYFVTLRTGWFISKRAPASWIWKSGKRKGRKIFRGDYGWLWGEWVHGFALWASVFVPIIGG